MGHPVVDGDEYGDCQVEGERYTKLSTTDCDPLEKQLSPFTKLWQTCSNPHLKIRPIAIFAFYSLNYSLAARLQDNSRQKSPTKVETKRKLQQFTVSGWLIINGGASDSEKRKL